MNVGCAPSGEKSGYGTGEYQYENGRERYVEIYGWVEHIVHFDMWPYQFQQAHTENESREARNGGYEYGFLGNPLRMPSPKPNKITRINIPDATESPVRKVRNLFLRMVSKISCHLSMSNMKPMLIEPVKSSLIDEYGGGYHTLEDAAN